MITATDSVTAPSGVPTCRLPITDPKFMEDPYSVFAELRERGPVVFDTGLNAYLVTRYEGVSEVLRDSRRFVTAGSFGGWGDVSSDSELNERVRALYRPPLWGLPLERHKKVRKLILSKLGPTAITAYAPMVRSHVRRLMAVWSPSEVVEVGREFAGPLTFGVMNEVLGLHEFPAHVLRRLSHVHQVLSVHAGDFPSPRPNLSASQIDTYVVDFVDGLSCLVKHMEILSLEQGKGLLSELFAVSSEVDWIDLEWIANQALWLYMAGTQSTIGSMCSLLYVLASDVWSSGLELLRRSPDRIPWAVDELFRMRPAFLSAFRRAAMDQAFCGAPILKDSILLAVFASANYDERIFHHPMEFRLNRPSTSRSLTFGGGAHTCVGAALARLELQIVLEELVERVDSVEIAGPIRWSQFFEGGPRRLPVRFTLR